MTYDNSVRPDRLLRFAPVAITAANVLLWFGICALVAAVAIFLIDPSALLADMTDDGMRVDRARATPWLPIVLFAVAGLLYLGIRFLSHLRAIARSAVSDPFVPENAARLRAMAWLLLATEIGGLVVQEAAVWLGAERRDGDVLALSSLIAVLALFVLARVFAHGTLLRDDVEGTV